jgi:hypothetical protein
VTLLGPYVTPMLVFAAVGLLGRSRAYAGAAAVVVAVHTVSGLLRV